MGDAAAKLPEGIDHLYEEAIQLPKSERRLLAERLLDSLDAPPDSDVERAWAQEATRRLMEIQGGRTEPSPWVVARARIFSRG